MPIINIEDSLFTDPRWFKILTKLGDEDKALGLLSCAWILAQKHWLEYKSVPKKVWPERLNILIETEFAQDLGDFIYVKGSKKQGRLLEQRQLAGKLSAKKRKERYGTAQPSKQYRTSPERAPNEPRTAPNRCSTKTKQIKEKHVIFTLEDKTIEVDKNLYISWIETYEQEFVLNEFKAAKNWLLANKHKSPKSNYARFMDGWLKRGWDRHRTTLKSKNDIMSFEDVKKVIKEAENEERRRRER